MTTVSDQVNLVLSEVQLLNAQRYGLSQNDFDKFATLMRERKGAGEDETSVENVADVLKDRIQDFVIGRIKNRIGEDSSKIQGYEPEQFRYLSAEDLMYDMVGRRDDRHDRYDSGISSLLNTHFDLNTLQMLNGA